MERLHRELSFFVKVKAEKILKFDKIQIARFWNKT